MAYRSLPVPTNLAICGGLLFATFAFNPKWHRVCYVGSVESWAIVDGKKLDFRLPACIDLSDYFIAKEFYDDKKTSKTRCKHRNTNVEAEIFIDEANGCAVMSEATWFLGRRLYVINESDRPFTTKEKLAVAGVVGVVAAVGAVLAAPAIIAGLGFGAGGIAKGSAAATAMSLGLAGVSTLQSIGAAGMGLTSVLVVGGSAAAVGSGVTAATVNSYSGLQLNKGAYYLNKNGKRLLVKVIHSTDSKLKTPCCQCCRPKTSCCPWRFSSTLLVLLCAIILYIFFNPDLVSSVLQLV